MNLQSLQNLELNNPVLIGISVGAISSLIGSFLGGSFSLLNTLISNRNLRLIEKEKWIRDNLQLVYSNCITSLSAVSNIFVGGGMTKGKEYYETASEASKWLNLLLLYHPSRKTLDYEDLKTGVLEFTRNPDNLKAAEMLRMMIIELAANDLRLK
jgi:hypothetical protein